MAWESMNTHPFKNIEKARSEIDRLMDTFLFGKPKKTGFAEEQGWQLPVDVAETEGELIGGLKKRRSRSRLSDYLGVRTAN